MSFKSIGVISDLCQALSRQNILRPTNIQTRAIPSILQTKFHHLVAAQTGTGKTLAYTLPLVQLLVEQQPAQGLVILPNTELTDQLTRVLDALPPIIKYSGFSPGKSIELERKAIEQGPQLCLMTPDRVERHLDQLNSMQYIVIDEFDTLVEVGQKNLLKKVFSTGLENQTRFIVVGATVPKPSDDFLQSYFSSELHGRLPYLHKVIQKKAHSQLRNLTHRFIELEHMGPSTALLKVLAEDSEQIMVFCSTVDRVEQLVRKLQTNCISAAALHGDLSIKHRKRNIEDFRQGNLRVLVSTDLGSRGLDFDFLTKVVQYDFPLTPSDYLHRAGRTGRAGKRGTVVTFHLKKDKPTVLKYKEYFDKKKPFGIQVSALTRNKNSALRKTGVIP